MKFTYVTQKDSPNVLYSSLLRPGQLLTVIAWMEQISLWFTNINWYNFPLALAGATIMVVKSQKNADGTWKHTPWLEWVTNIALSTISAMVLGEDLGKLLPFLPLLLSHDGTIFISGLVSWYACDQLIFKSKNSDPGQPTNP